MTADLATQQRRHIADILRAHQSGHLDLTAAVDAIELDVFGQKHKPEAESPMVALVTTVLSSLIYADYRNEVTASEAVSHAARLADTLQKRGYLAALEG